MLWVNILIIYGKINKKKTNNGHNLLMKYKHVFLIFFCLYIKYMLSKLLWCCFLCELKNYYPSDMIWLYGLRGNRLLKKRNSPSEQVAKSTWAFNPDAIVPNLIGKNKFSMVFMRKKFKICNELPLPNNQLLIIIIS